MKRLVIGAIVLIVVLMLAVGIFSDGEPEPDEPPIPITARELYREREMNATRYDQNYKGKWVRISGIVSSVDGGAVKLAADESSFFSIGMSVKEVWLNDLSTGAQASVSAGDRVAATCKVGDFIILSIMLNDCRP